MTEPARSNPSDRLAADGIVNLSYDVFVNDPPPQSGRLPNGEPKLFSPMASTLVYGDTNAILTDPGLTAGQAKVLGDWVAAKNRNVTDIFITHGHGDHWFAADSLAKQFGARIVATTGTIQQMRAGLGTRPLIWDKIYTDIPESPVTAVAVPGNLLAVDGHEARIVEVGNTDTTDTSVLHVPDLDLVVAGDVIYNGVHMFLGQAVVVDGSLRPWRAAIDMVEALAPRHIVAGHQNKQHDDDARRTIEETRQYLDDADDAMRTQHSALDYFNAKIARYPNHLGRTVLWATANAIYDAREAPGEDVRQILVRSWFY